MSEDRQAKFKRLASRRTTNLLNQLRLLGNLSSANYEYTDEDIRKIFRAIDEKLRIVKSKFKDKIRKKNKFEL